MADSNPERQRRYRAHKSGDHRLCNKDRCRDAGVGPPAATAEQPDPVWASGEQIPDSVAEAFRADINALGELVGIEGSLASMALKLGKAIDTATDPKELAALSREARSTLTDLTLSLKPRLPPGGERSPGGNGSEVSDGKDGWSGMDMPV